MHRHLPALLLAAMTFLASPGVKAGIPVIDVTAVANLMQQIAYWQQQIASMQKQYDQLKASKEQLTQTYGALTGTRGMEQMLPIPAAARNYLPPSYGELMNTLNGSSTSYAGLASHVQSIMQANSVLSATQVNALSPELRRVVEQGRRSAALLSGMSQSAYQHTSQRFSTLQQLITHIAAAQDPKAIQDLQARIQAEQSMLTNEQTKLQSLYQAAQSEELMRKQRIREQSAFDIGSTRSLPSVTY